MLSLAGEDVWNREALGASWTAGGGRRGGGRGRGAVGGGGHGRESAGGRGREGAGGGRVGAVICRRSWDREVGMALYGGWESWLGWSG